MAHIGHIDKEKQAAKTLELFNREKDGFVRSACHSYTAGVSPEQTREALVRKIKSRMEDVLFEHLKRTGDVRGSFRHEYTMGYLRTVRREPRKATSLRNTVTSKRFSRTSRNWSTLSWRKPASSG